MRLNRWTKSIRNPLTHVVLESTGSTSSGKVPRSQGVLSLVPLHLPSAMWLYTQSTRDVKETVTTSIWRKLMGRSLWRSILSRHVCFETWKSILYVCIPIYSDFGTKKLDSDHKRWHATVAAQVANSIRVIKTKKQTSSENCSYISAAQEIIEKDLLDR